MDKKDYVKLKVFKVFKCKFQVVQDVQLMFYSLQRIVTLLLILVIHDLSYYPITNVNNYHSIINQNHRSNVVE
jgi:hypothetical protein